MMKSAGFGPRFFVSKRTPGLTRPAHLEDNPATFRPEILECRGLTALCFDATCHVEKSADMSAHSNPEPFAARNE
jgi:hypothetical protein